MTPFVDVGFLILFFFIMATKFKPPEPITITTPHSVSAQKLMEKAAKTYDPVTYEGAGHGFMRAGEDPDDKNPANKNTPGGRPDSVSAVNAADAPGAAVTGRSSASAARTSL